jgi:hypothetical protein
MMGALLQGIGTAMVYPTPLAPISDVAHPFVARKSLESEQLEPVCAAEWRVDASRRRCLRS